MFVGFSVRYNISNQTVTSSPKPLMQRSVCLESEYDCWPVMASKQADNAVRSERSLKIYANILEKLDQGTPGRWWRIAIQKPWKVDTGTGRNSTSENGKQTTRVGETNTKEAAIFFAKEAKRIVLSNQMKKYPRLTDCTIRLKVGVGRGVPSLKSNTLKKVITALCDYNLAGKRSSSARNYLQTAPVAITGGRINFACYCHHLPIFYWKPTRALP